MKKILLIILFVFIAVSFLTLPRNPLLNDDAALYALAAKNAILHNQWLAQFVTPGDLSSFLDKPPLGIWLLAWFPKLVGLNELTIHFPNVLYYSLTLLFLYLFLVRLSSKKIAFYSTLIAATSLALVVYSRSPKLDVLLTLFILIAHLSLFDYLKNDRPASLFPFTISLACGFLVKSGFGLLMTAMLLIFLLVLNAEAREKLFALLVTRYTLIYSSIFLIIIGGILYAQSFALKGEWLNYIRSITIQSKYNTSYLGLGFNYSIVGFLLLTLFPWMPLFFKGLKLPWNLRINSCLPAGTARFHKEQGTETSVSGSGLTLPDFCSLWFWSNFLFFLFFFRQTDFRTFTILVPPMAILAGTALEENKGSKTTIGWALFFLAIFSLILFSTIINPQNQQGFSLIDAIVPVAFFVVSLLSLTIYFWKPSAPKLVISFVLICLSYSVLFWNTKPIANAFNPDLKWPQIIREYREKGYPLYIYRPPDRQLFYSPDLFWVDFMSGPAERYFSDRENLLRDLTLGKAVILSDTKSWEKLGLKGTSIAQDSYSSLIKMAGLSLR